MIYQQVINFELHREELYKRLMVYFKVNNYRIRRAAADTIIAENPLPFTLERHPLRLISYFEIKLDGQGDSTVMYLKTDYGNLRKFVRRIFRLVFFVAVLPLLFLIVKIGLLFQSYGESSLNIWMILVINLLIGIMTLGVVWVFSKKKFTNLQKMLVFGSKENPELHQKICMYFKELLQG